MAEKKSGGGKIDKVHGGREIAKDSAFGNKQRPTTVSYDKPIPPEKPKKG